MTSDYAGLESKLGAARLGQCLGMTLREAVDGRGGATDNRAMTARVLRLPFSLDPVIAEAKRRARRRRVLVAMTVVLVVGAVGGGLVASRSSTGAAGPRPAQAAAVASVYGRIEQPNGLNPPGPDPGVFSPRFGILVLVANGSDEPITLERVQAVLHSWTPVGQIGSRFKVWKPPPGCVGPAGLPCTQVPPAAERPVSAERPSPLRIAPRHQVLVQLNFRLLTCTRRESQEPVSLQKLTVLYRLPNETQVEQHAPFMLGYTYPALVRRPGSLPENQIFGPFGYIMTRPCHR